MKNVLQFTHYYGERKTRKIFHSTHFTRENAFCLFFMFQYRFNQVLLELNMMKWGWETSLVVLRAPTLRGASKCWEQLSTGWAQSCEHRGGWRPPCMGPATLGTVSAGLHRLGQLTVYGRSTGSSLTQGEADNGSQGLIKYLQALDFVLTFCVKLNSHEKEKPAGWVGTRQSEAAVEQASVSISANRSPLAKPIMLQAQVLAEKKLLIKQHYVTLCGVFSKQTKAHWGLSWDHRTLFILDPEIRLECWSLEAAVADCSLFISKP